MTLQDYNDKSFTLSLLANDVTFRRMEKAAEQLAEVASRVINSTANMEDVPECLKVVFGIGTNIVDDSTLISPNATRFGRILMWNAWQV